MEEAEFHPAKNIVERTAQPGSVRYAPLPPTLSQEEMLRNLRGAPRESGGLQRILAHRRREREVLDRKLGEVLARRGRDK